MDERETRPPLWLSLLPVGFLLAVLTTNVAVFRDEASSGPNQLGLLLSAMFAGLIGRVVLKCDYRAVERHAIQSIVLAMEAVIILLVVGALIGTWIMSGVVPAMIYHGIRLISPGVFLLVACVICSVVSLAIGSSWSTMGTVGVALIGMGKVLGFPDGLVAGAVISGAYFGDKMSPLSDTTNLAPAVAGTDLFTHIQHMIYTTIPAYSITLVTFAVIGLFFHSDAYHDPAVAEMAETLRQHFNVSGYLLLIPLAVVVLVGFRMPAIPALVIGLLLGAATAVVFQRQPWAGDGGVAAKAAYARVASVAYSGFASETGNEAVDQLLSRGGMVNMTNTVILIVMAMVFGGIMEATGMLPRIAEAILHLAHGAGSLIATTIGTCIVVNLTASEQYLSIVISGRMFQSTYKAYGLDPRNLSRALEDGGTVTSVLVPWNTCGAFASGVLGVPTLTYLPYCVFNLVSPVVSATMAGMGVAIKRLAAEGESGEAKNRSRKDKPRERQGDPAL
ncbi:MAG TPA: Na+/H+ antiporter NhaC [Candidatus Hydrogenedentes bacterium]|nr:Na+/H+ antiporter NhaC [Candidatus Hydrogenedentota bacterium]HPG67958.1 Na+/H+ antiporter NhaC [Candidatus Hydrogenedentota bacterium]